MNIKPTILRAHLFRCLLNPIYGGGSLCVKSNGAANKNETAFKSLHKQQSTSPNKPQATAAFTLIELIITMSILSIILMLALPSFSNMLLNKSEVANSDALVNGLNFARSTALNQSMNVQVCPLGTLGSTSCGSNWSSGWIVVTLPAAGSSTLIQSQQLSPTGPILSATVASVVFDSHSLATTQSDFKFCDSRGGAYALSLEVLATGFVQSGSTPGQAVWDNSSLTCP
ncbi:MAG: GspH/FimT family pseudopilin [Legionellales bacterium]